jgi:hypothetical protein
VQLDLARVLPAELGETLGRVARAAVGRHRVLRAVLHAVPHLAAAEAARDLLDRAVGHVGDPARGRELALAAQQLRDRLAEARLPDEVDGVDAVREPPGRQGARHREPASSATSPPCA